MKTSAINEALEIDEPTGQDDGKLVIFDVDDSHVISSPTDRNKDIDSDYCTVRERLINSLEKGNMALNGIIVEAAESGHPRAYEVVATLLKSINDTSKQLMDLHTSMDKVSSTSKESNKESTTTNNNVFIGNSTELQKMLKSLKK